MSRITKLYFQLNEHVSFAWPFESFENITLLELLPISIINVE